MTGRQKILALCAIAAALALGASAPALLDEEPITTSQTGNPNDIWPTDSNPD